MHWITKAASACLLALYMLVGVVVPSSAAQTTEPLSCDIGVLVGTDCFIEGPLPTEGGLACPVSATVFESPFGECYSIIGGAVLLDDCVVGYVATGVNCKVTNTGATTAELASFSCPTAPVTPTESIHTTSGVTKIESCTYVPGSVESCPAFTSADPDGGCRRPAARLSSGLVCVAPFELSSGRCVQIVAAMTTADPTSPSTGSLTCDTGVLIGTNCVLEGPLPAEGGLTCPVSATVFESPFGECYSIIGGAVLLDDCVVGYVATGVNCKVTNTGTTTAELASFSCPTAPATPTENMHTTSGVTKIESCTYVPGSVESCPINTSADPDGGCRQAAPLASGLVCVAPFEFIDARCLLVTAAVGTITSTTTTPTAGLGMPLAPTPVPGVNGTFAGGALACSATAAEVTIVVPPIVNVWTNRDLDVSVNIGGAVAFTGQLAADRTIVISIAPAMEGEQTVTFSSTLLNGAGYTVSCSEPLTIP